MELTTVTIGEGRLSWRRGERISDRYGTVLLLAHGDSLSKTVAYIDPDASMVGTVGSLVAVVLETRESTHIGDLFRGLFPSTPDVGDEIALGTGRLFVDPRDPDGFISIGLDPEDGRDSDWLDPARLYRAHEQTVRLEFRPAVVS